MQLSPRVLIVPGLHDSGPAHWQTWLERQVRGAKRVKQHRFDEPDLARWSERIGSVLAAEDPAQPWLAVAHSFGVLALAQHLAQQPASPIRAALLVAPADPDRFGVADVLPQHRLDRPLTLVSSDNDPWMRPENARRWAQRWGAHTHALGRVGHINAESGFGPFPLALRWVEQARQRVARADRPEHASFWEWTFAL